MQSHENTSSTIASRNLVLIGAPGAGKGTQSTRLASIYQLAHISTGEMLRSQVQAESSLGMRALAQIESGSLVSDDLVIALVVDRLRQPDARGGCVLDGFPRTVHQAEVLDQILDESNSHLECCIYLSVDSQTILQRIDSRAKIERRSDDAVDTLRKRIEVFENQMAPLINYYQRRDLLVAVSGTGSRDEVAADIRRALGQKQIANVQNHTQFRRASISRAPNQVEARSYT